MRIRHLVVALLLMSAGPARAACPLIGTLPAAPNDFELQFGATNTNAALGSGRLTATLSACGEITSLKWPGPSYWNQLDYLTDNSVGARLEPHFGALDDAGAFAGIAYRTRAGSGFTWLRDDPWTHAQQYTADDSDVAVTVTTNAALGLTVTAWTFVLPDGAGLARAHGERRLLREPRTDHEPAAGLPGGRLGARLRERLRGGLRPSRARAARLPAPERRHLSPRLLARKPAPPAPPGGPRARARRRPPGRTAHRARHLPRARGRTARHRLPGRLRRRPALQPSERDRGSRDQRLPAPAHLRRHRPRHLRVRPGDRRPGRAARRLPRRQRLDVHRGQRLHGCRARRRPLPLAHCRLPDERRARPPPPLPRRPGRGDLLPRSRRHPRRRLRALAPGTRRHAPRPARRHRAVVGSVPRARAPPRHDRSGDPRVRQAQPRRDAHSHRQRKRRHRCERQHAAALRPGLAARRRVHQLCARPRRLP